MYTKTHENASILQKISHGSLPCKQAVQIYSSFHKHAPPPPPPPPSQSGNPASPG